MISIISIFLYLLSCGDVTNFVINSSEEKVRMSFKAIYENCTYEALKIPCGFPILEVSEVDLRSGFGIRYHPIDKVKKGHFGVDLASPQNPIIATGQGRVVYAGKKGGYGLHIVIDHGNSYTTSYSHLSEIHVNVGDDIDIAQKIGRVGNTGKSTGNHLHYEVKKNGEYVDPAPYLLLFYKATTY